MSSDITSWSFNNVTNWLRNINLDMYFNNFKKFNVNGYDLYNLCNDDFNQLNIGNFHDKNIILKSIKLLVLEQLKIKVSYQSKSIEIQLDFDPKFTVGNLCHELIKIYNISEEIYLSNDDGNCLLMPNVKIVELILLEPEKYKNFKIIEKRNIKFSDKNKEIYYTNKTKNNNINNERNDNKYKSKNYIYENNPNYILDKNKKNNKFDNKTNYKDSNYYTPPSEREFNINNYPSSYTPNNRERNRNKNNNNNDIKEMKRESSYNTLNYNYDDTLPNKNYKNENEDIYSKNSKNKISSYSQNKFYSKEGIIVNKMNNNKLNEVRNKNKYYFYNDNIEEKDLMNSIDEEQLNYDNRFNYNSNLY